MEFRIADTFSDSLANLSKQEQRAVKTTAFDLQMNVANPGLRFHKLERAKDSHFWSVSVNLDIRIIIHKTDASMLLCYVAHHDRAYAWAQCRKVEAHPKTGAAQLVEIRETIKEIVIPTYKESEKRVHPKPSLFMDKTDDELLQYGIPVEWLEEVKKANEDTILEVADHLPGEAAEALLDLATGKTPPIPYADSTITDPFEHPDAKRRFRVMKNIEELEQALDFPWEKWSVFLHPEQQQIIEKNYNGPARVSGSAGTGKTIVALHRAVYLTKNNPDSRVLLVTFSEILANALRNKLKVLLRHTPRLGERLEVYSMDDIGQRLYKLNIGRFKMASNDELTMSIKTSAKQIKAHTFSLHFLFSEWEQIVDAWQLDTWEEYRSIPRLGRKTRLPEKQRQILWSIFELVRNDLKTKDLITNAQLFNVLAERITEIKSPFDYVVIDESQDINVPQLRFLSSLGAGRTNSLFFTGDLGQRIFQQPFSWKALNVTIRGRSKTLRINYRTSHQIRIQADRLLEPELHDVDGNRENRSNTISIFNGTEPEINVFNSNSKECFHVGNWIAERIQEGIEPQEIGIFVRTVKQMERAISAVENSDQNYKILDEVVETVNDHVTIGTMHLAKGLEFRAVAVMACDDEIIPLQERIESVTDDADLEEVYNTERHLLYVACTRARDYLLVTAVEPESEFLDDIKIM